MEWIRTLPLAVVHCKNLQYSMETAENSIGYPILVLWNSIFVCDIRMVVFVAANFFYLIARCWIWTWESPRLIHLYIYEHCTHYTFHNRGVNVKAHLGTFGGEERAGSFSHCRCARRDGVTLIRWLHAALSGKRNRMHCTEHGNHMNHQEGVYLSSAGLSEPRYNW